MPTLKQLAGLSQAREAYHRSDGPDTGTNSRGMRNTTKKISAVINLGFWYSVFAEIFWHNYKSTNWHSGIGAEIQCHKFDL